MRPLSSVRREIRMAHMNVCLRSFIFWPSFNGALASGQPGTLTPGPFQQFNCIINTVLSLLGATVATFILSSALTGKFDMVRACCPMINTHWGSDTTVKGCVSCPRAKSLLIVVAGCPVGCRLWRPYSCPFTVKNLLHGRAC